MNLPGSERGARESLQSVLELLPHAVELLKGDAGEQHPVGEAPTAYRHRHRHRHRHRAMVVRLRLIRASLEAPAGLVEFLAEIGAGESGFSGEREVVAGPPAAGALSGGFDVEAVLRRLVDMAEGRNLPDGFVPMTTFWALDDADRLVGVIRLRHRLNDFLLLHGGHIGYYVARSQRGNGYATEMLRQTLIEARELGIERALLTVHTDNAASIRVIERNGGVLENEVLDPTSGKLQRRYWIDLT